MEQAEQRALELHHEQVRQHQFRGKVGGITGDVTGVKGDATRDVTSETCYNICFPTTSPFTL